MSKRENETYAPLELLDSIQRNSSSVVLNPVLFNVKDYSYIWNNLKHNLRDYQMNAVANFHYGLNYKKWDWGLYSEKPNKNLIDQNHFMFWMATGSGKTDIMAALILYLYKEQGMQNFLFTTTLTSIIMKTEDNFLNPLSPKYLFNKEIWIDGHRVKINQVSTFAVSPESYTINILISNIDTLSNLVNHHDKEGIGQIGTTLYDFIDRDYVILADEAHHFNAATKGAGGAYEETLDQLRNIGHKTYQLEFTATLNRMDGHSSIYKKYKDKVVDRFDLGEFSKARYSKRVLQIASNLTDEQKMMQGLLMNIARQLIARDKGIKGFKPIILFKSSTKSRSKQAHQEFVQLINTLDEEKVNAALSEVESTNQNIKLITDAVQRIRKEKPLRIITMMQQQFSTIGDINDEKDTQFLDYVNTLESPDSPYRVVFAVEKLTEGWDVLNLFDIVKMDDSKVSKAATNREAQLVGRGARYYPFALPGESTPSYQRRFDKSGFESQLLETLLFHTIRKDKYIDNITKSYREIGLNVLINQDAATVYSTQLKKAVRNLPAWQHGVVFENQLRRTNKDDYQNLRDYGVQFSYTYDLRNQSLLQKIAQYDLNNTKDDETKRIIELSPRVLQHASYDLEFYRYQTLKYYLPGLRSLRNFFNDYVEPVQVKVTVDSDRQKITVAERLTIAKDYLNTLAAKIKKNYLKEVGTASFSPVSIKDRFDSYSRTLPDPQTVTDPKYSKKPRSGLWFPFTVSIGDQEEQYFVDMIQNNIDAINNIIGPKRSFMLLRNDEVAHHLTLHEINGIRNYMPDFILVINGQDYSTIQFYLEPKGKQLKEKDTWKQDLLLKIEQISRIKGYAGEAKLYGLPFFSSSASGSFKKELLQKLNSIFATD
ncbi:DEAD/DEAH box helicase family protein [Limosilactobacillus fermentum]|uniref:DEAD/DEAH box helicase family protein n=1 Tax=Limosilactobacillus fermentum TaxID=1613 RepID=UPI002F25EF66